MDKRLKKGNKLVRERMQPIIESMSNLIKEIKTEVEVKGFYTFDRAMKHPDFIKNHSRTKEGKKKELAPGIALLSVIPELGLKVADYKVADGTIIYFYKNEDGKNKFEQYIRKIMVVKEID